MKYILILFLFSYIHDSYSQKYLTKDEIPSLITSYFGGAFEGTSDALQFHYSDFNKVFQKNNPSFWNPSYSWTNKYKNGDYKQGPKYFGSTSFLVWTTDGYHTMRFSRNIMITGTFILYPKKKKNWKMIVFDTFLHSAAYHAGFFTTYDVIFK